MMKYHACPRCGRNIAQSGELDIDGATAAVFQCDECFDEVELLGEKVESALTFAVDADGRVFDPADDASLG